MYFKQLFEQTLNEELSNEFNDLIMELIKRNINYGENIKTNKLIFDPPPSVLFNEKKRILYLKSWPIKSLGKVLKKIEKGDYLELYFEKFIVKYTKNDYLSIELNK